MCSYSQLWLKHSIWTKIPFWFFFLTLCVKLQWTARNPVLKGRGKSSLKRHSGVKRAVCRHLCMTTKSFQRMVLWRFGVYFPKQNLVDVQSRISSSQKLTRCCFMRLKDAVEHLWAPVLPFFLDFVVEESDSPPYKKIWTIAWKRAGWQDAHL